MRNRDRARLTTTAALLCVCVAAAASLAAPAGPPNQSQPGDASRPAPAPDDFPLDTSCLPPGVTSEDEYEQNLAGSLSAEEDAIASRSQTARQVHGPDPHRRDPDPHPHYRAGPDARLAMGPPSDPAPNDGPGAGRS